MPGNLDLSQLRPFFVLSQTLSFTKAAWRLHVSQSAVSHAIKKLESVSGLTLIARRGRNFALTPEGERLALSCQAVFGELQRVEDVLFSPVKRIQAIRLGATVEFGTLVLIRHMKPFMVQNDDIHLDFRFTNDPLPGLMSDELDIIVDCKRHALPALEKTDLFREEYAVVAAPSFLRGKVIAAPKDLEGKALISLDKNASWWGRFMQVIPRRDRPVIKREAVVEINHIRGIINASAGAVGIALLPKYAIIPELRRRTLVNIFPDITIREDQFSIYQKKKRASLDANRRVAAYLKQLRPEEFG